MLQEHPDACQGTSASPDLAARAFAPAAQVIVVSSVMFTFISYWRTAAVVLCDLASTAYYIGGIVEQPIGKAAPWFILAVMLFSYAVRCVYIESCSLFVRGGVYRVVKEAMGGFLAKLAVSALMFDYILTGPISGVSAGQYIIGLLAGGSRDTGSAADRRRRPTARQELGLGRASPSPITLYFCRQNLIGIHESSDKALKIMIATTVMARHHDRSGAADHAGRQGPGTPSCPPADARPASKKVELDPDRPSSSPKINPLDRRAGRPARLPRTAIAPATCACSRCEHVRRAG